MVMMIIVIIGTFKRWSELLRIKERVQDVWGEMVIAPIEGETCVLPVKPQLSAQEKQATEKWT
jgi:hypothetical protein